ncbi:MAG: pyridoxamine 5'-phosphate oxidase family protein [Sumerlaeia bacterium]
MSNWHENLDEKLVAFIESQPVFFTASAPLAGGRVNVSPKGMDTFRVLDDRTVAYLDLTGSGNETAAHLRENGRLTIMMCNFQPPPLILRLYGQGQVIGMNHPRWAELAPLFPQLLGTRQIILLPIDSIQTSCGYGVPRMEFFEERQTLVKYWENQPDGAIPEYWKKKNLTSIDGLETGLAERLPS